MQNMLRLVICLFLIGAVHMANGRGYSPEEIAEFKARVKARRQEYSEGRDSRCFEAMAYFFDAVYGVVQQDMWL